MLLTILLGVSVGVLSAVYFYYKYVLLNFWRERGVFYIEPVVPTGNLTSLVLGKLSLGEFYQDAYMKYKDHRVVGMYSFFKPQLLIADLDLVQTVLVREFGSFHDRGVFCNERIDPLTGHLFLLSGKRWRNLRVKLTPTFTSGKIKQMFMILRDSSECFAKSLESKARARDCIEIKELLARYFTDVIMSTAFGINSNCIEQPDNEFRRWGKRTFSNKPLRNALFVFTPQIMNFISVPYTDRGVTSFFTKMFRSNVEYRRAHNVVRHDFMNLLMQLMEKGYVDPDDNNDVVDKSPVTNKLTMLEAAAQAYVFYVGGFETSSNVATFCLYELAKNQEIQDKLRAEIDETLEKHGGLSYDAVSEMTYLHKVVSESLRKYPPFVILLRACTKDVDLPTTNVRMTEGTSAVIPVFALHRDPSIYPDPERFDPERFNAENVAARHPYAYLPFGEGPRICIGARFGYMQIKTGLVGLLSKFKFRLHPRTPLSLALDARSIMLAAKGDVHLIIEPR